MPPTAKIPEPATELVARQSGERVLLRWTAPRRHTDGTRLEKRPQFEVYRAFVPTGADWESSFTEQARIAYTLPPAVMAGFLRNEIVVFPDLLSPTMLEQQAGRLAVFGVKAVNEKGQDAGFSNLAAVRVYPVPRPIGLIETKVTEAAVELSWPPPERTTSGPPVEAIAGYEIYRSATGEEGSYALHGTAATASYRDSEFQFGGRYYYRVRTLAQFGGDTVESDLSTPVEVRPRDLFPPPAPANLIAVAGTGRVDLTWDASEAADLAGYNVYRSRESGRGYRRLNPSPIAGQTFADTTSLEAGTTYYYAVAAVDAEGNESAFSNEVAVTPVEQD